MASYQQNNLDEFINVNKSQITYQVSSWEDGLRVRMDLGKGFRPWLLLGHVLNDKGEPLVHPVQKSDIADPEGFIDELAGEITPILESIPEKIRKLAAPFKDDQWLALDAMRHLEGFDDFVEMELAGAGTNFIQSCWELTDTRRNRSLMERQDLNRRIFSMKRTDLIAKLSDIPCGKGFIRNISRLKSKFIQRETLKNLLVSTQSPRKLQAISTTQHLFPSLIESVLLLPEWMTFPAVVDALGEMGEDLKGVGSVFPPRILEAHENYHDRIAQSIRNVKGIEQLESRIATWTQKLFVATHFPSPPIPGNQLLMPISNDEGLELEGKEMSHCVSGYAEDVAEGLSFFYRWLGRERATVQLAKSVNGRWYIKEHLGKQNARLSDEAVQEITLNVASQMKDGLFLFKTHIAGTQYHQAFDAADEMQEETNRIVVLKREPDNQYDQKAIEVFTSSGVKLGYIPRQNNGHIAGLMDTGFHITGHTTRFSANSHSAEIRVELFLTGKQKEANDQEFWDYSYQELPNTDMRVASMVGGI